MTALKDTASLHPQLTPGYKNVLLIFCFVLPAFFWSGSFIAIRYAVNDFPVVVAVFLRVASAWLTIGLWRFIVQRGDTVLKPDAGALWSGLLAFGLPFLLLFWAEKTIEPALSAIVNGLVPVLVAVLTPFVNKQETLSPSKRGAALLGFLGLCVIFIPSLIHHSLNRYTLGLVATVLMSVCYTLSILWNKKLTARLDHLSTVWSQLTGALLMLLPFFLWQTWHTAIDWSVLQGWSAVLYLGVISTALARVMFLHTIRELGGAVASTTIYLIPVITIVLDYLFFGHVLAGYQLLGAAVIIAAIYLVNKK